MAFASGKFSQAICDRCGFQVPYLNLSKEWNGLLVCQECFEPKHPQLDPGYHSALVVTVGIPNDTFFTSNGMQPSTISDDLNIGTSVGTVEVVIT